MLVNRYVNLSIRVHEKEERNAQTPSMLELYLSFSSRFWLETPITRKPTVRLRD